jgi:hypothetical protein|uniref:Uncharacterized protein n=1 Tax=Desulfobacca acetoxidans TaxID=60893 RepID=A0A7V6DQY5_9BACT
MRKKTFLWPCLGLLFLALSFFGTRAKSAETLPAAQEAALFSLKDLGPVDLAPKRVVLEIYASPAPDLSSFEVLFPQAWPLVQAFYANMGVLLELVPGKAAAGKLVPGKHLRLEALTHDEWLDRTFQAFQVEPPFRKRFLRVCQDKYAFAHLNLSVIHMDFKHIQKDILSNRSKEARYNPNKLANLIIHEMGHLFGLYHANEFVNDPIPETLPDGRTPDFMSQNLAQPHLGFVDFQKRLVHSYLSGGKVFQQYRYVDFDPLRYLELIRQYNNYQEPKP